MVLRYILPMLIFAMYVLPSFRVFLETHVLFRFRREVVQQAVAQQLCFWSISYMENLPSGPMWISLGRWRLRDLHRIWRREWLVDLSGNCFHSFCDEMRWTDVSLCQGVGRVCSKPFSLMSVFSVLACWLHQYSNYHPLKQRSFESPIISSPIKSSKQMFNSFSKLFSRRKTSWCDSIEL